MRKIVHLSDLHFGRTDAALLEPLRQRVKAIAPDLVVVSGDLTQRAKPWQFREAKAFLDTLPKPQVVVPGNHDIPLYNLFQRFFAPLDKYRRYVGGDLEPQYIDDEIAVVGINTARSLTWKNGRINTVQVEKVRSKICHLPDHVAKIIVTHHPFDVPAQHDDRDLVDRADMAMRVFAACGADMLLSGHLHKTHTGHSAERYKIPGHSALIVQAGTATSTRARGESNSFNALHVTPDGVAIERYEWQPDARDFTLRSTERFRHAPDGWHPTVYFLETKGLPLMQ
jgi:3',5'-cyclic AMP phosphodiesterase CpdA